MLPHVVGRPITIERYPGGIDHKGFIQKDVSKGFPAWLERVEAAKRGPKEEIVHYPLATDARSLVWLANQNSITPHVWPSRLPRLEHPDLCVFDLDPSTDDPSMLRAAALAVRALLDELSLPSFVKTSGSKGFHIVIPLDGAADFDEVRRFAQGAGAVLVKRRTCAADPRVHQSRSREPNLHGHRSQRPRRNPRGGLRRPSARRGPGIGALHLARDRTRRGGPSELHPAHDVATTRRGRRSVVWDRTPRMYVGQSDDGVAKPSHGRRVDRVARRVDP